MHHTTSKSTSLLWILVAYLSSIAAAGVYLYFKHANLLLDSFIADVLGTLVIFGFSRAFRNSSFYDANWSVIPPLLLLYWWYANPASPSALRYGLVSLVVWYWAIRLTWNWAKHWEGLGQEDWRYPMVRQKAGQFEWLADLFGIHLFSTVQVFLCLLPMYAATTLASQPVGWLDALACIVGVAAVTIQLLADRQLHRFITHRKPGEIIQTGLWGWSRHPNYFGEVCFWLSLALFGLAAYPEGWWWQPIGFVSMLSMFLLVSIPLMEKRSLERRPDYQQVINRISMLIPLPPK